MADKQQIVRLHDGAYGVAEASQLLSERQGYADSIKLLETERSKIDARLMVIVGGWHSEYPGAAFDLDVGQDVEMMRVRISQNEGRRRIVPERLLELGVPIETIERATVQEPPSKPFIRADRIGGQRREGA